MGSCALTSPSKCSRAYSAGGLKVSSSTVFLGSLGGAYPATTQDSNTTQRPAGLVPFAHFHMVWPWLKSTRSLRPALAGSQLLRRMGRHRCPPTEACISGTSGKWIFSTFRNRKGSARLFLASGHQTAPSLRPRGRSLFYHSSQPLNPLRILRLICC